MNAVSNADADYRSQRASLLDLQIINSEPGQPALPLRYKQPRQAIVPCSEVSSDRSEFIACMSSEHFGQLAWQFKRMSGSSGLKVQAAIAC